MTKKEYLNSINHDLNYYKTEMAAHVTHVWHHGDLLSRFQVHQRIKELENDLKQIETDKNYKPWK